MYKQNIRFKNSTLERKNLMAHLSPIKKVKKIKEKDIFKEVVKKTRGSTTIKKKKVKKY